jgi:RNA recognition motif-containing protein
MDKSNLIVNYLQTNVGEEDLNALFSSYGPIQSLKIVRDKGTGISMGFGFVNFETNEAANGAADALNGLELNGKRIKVSVARPAWKANIHSNLYIANLPTGFTENEVLGLVGPELATHIEHVRMLKSNDSGNSSTNEFRGVAVARFDTEEFACIALENLSTLTIESPLTGARMQIHAKPWRPEFRPERAAGAVPIAPRVPNRRKLSIDDAPSLLLESSTNTSTGGWISPPLMVTPPPPPPATTASSSLRPNVKPFVPAASRMYRPMPPSRGTGSVITEQEEMLLVQSFDQFGALPGVTMYVDRSWGYVRFPSMHAAMAAVQNLSGFNVNGKLLEMEAAL